MRPRWGSKGRRRSTPHPAGVPAALAQRGGSGAAAPAKDGSQATFLVRARNGRSGVPARRAVWGGRPGEESRSAPLRHRRSRRSRRLARSTHRRGRFSALGPTGIDHGDVARLAVPPQDRRDAHGIGCSPRSGHGLHRPRCPRPLRGSTPPEVPGRSNGTASGQCVDGPVAGRSRLRAELEHLVVARHRGDDGRAEAALCPPPPPRKRIRPRWCPARAVRTGSVPSTSRMLRCPRQLRRDLRRPTARSPTAWCA